jgi:cyclopropane fatty-acyl-phospholipid synthase-like methyltransferase
MSFDAFFRIHDGMQREAPGDEASTLTALARLGPLPPGPRVLDLGCGPGGHTLELARALPDANIVAVDLHAPFIERLAREVAEQGLATRVHSRVADFGALDEAEGTIDLIWSEGAIYHLGFETGLRRWRPLLRAGGAMAITELTWLGPAQTRPAEAREFWAAAYPAMTTIAANCAAAEAAGLRVLETFTLPERAWAAYYEPLAARVEALRGEAEHDPALATAIADTMAEIDLWRRCGAHYGYVFYLLHA